MSKRVLIIGGAGFIGVNAAKRFIDEGHAVTLFDNLSRKGTDLNLAWLESEYHHRFVFVRGDVRHDQSLLEKLVGEHDVVIHLAAQVAVTTSVIDPRTDFEINAGGTFNVLEAIRTSSNKPCLIFASTNKVYGDLEDLKIEEKPTRYALVDFPNGVSEAQTLDFHSPYGCSKGSADQYVRDYARIYGLKTVVFRQSCIYGRHQYGVEDQGWIAWFMIAFLLGKPVSLYGNGKQVRDVLFVDDLTALYAAAVERMDTMSGKAYNVGGGMNNALSLLEFLDTLKAKHGIDVRYDVKGIRPGDQKVFVSDNTMVMRDAQWRPNVHVNEGFEKILTWVKANLNTIKTLY